MDWADWKSNKSAIQFLRGQTEEYDNLVVDDTSGVKQLLNMNEWLNVVKIGGAYSNLIRIPGGDKANFMCEYADSANLSDEDFIKLVFLNAYDNYPDDEILSKMIIFYEEIGKDRHAFILTVYEMRESEINSYYQYAIDNNLSDEEFIRFVISDYYNTYYDDITYGELETVLKDVQYDRKVFLEKLYYLYY